MRKYQGLLVLAIVWVTAACNNTERADDYSQPASAAGTYLDKQSFAAHANFQAQFIDSSAFCVANQGSDGIQITSALLVKNDGSVFMRKLSADPSLQGRQSMPGFHANFVNGVGEELVGQISGKSIEFDSQYLAATSTDLGTTLPSALKVLVTKQNLAFVSDGTVQAPPQQSIFYRISNMDYEAFKANFMNCPRSTGPSSAAAQSPTQTL